ncbi:MAG TPA: hypothetical protein VFB21_04060 [Chthonomonadaceae bacterium]|nr:hypothetical protein [Chthonomonadaceae bacterium]
MGDVGAPQRGTQDPDILLWCEEYDFVLVTNNRKSMPRHLADHLAAGHHVPGILTVDLEASVGVVTEFLAAIAGASYEGEYQDRIAYIPLR